MSGPTKEYTIKNVLLILRKLPKRDQRIIAFCYNTDEALHRLRKILRKEVQKV